MAAIRGLSHDAVEVRLPDDLQELDGLIMPGGESTTFSRLMDLYQLKAPIVNLASDGIRLWGTCAGMIMMARELTEPDPVPMRLMDIGLTRNGYGRQVDSFEEDLDVPALGSGNFPCHIHPRSRNIDRGLRSGRIGTPVRREPGGGASGLYVGDRFSSRTHRRPQVSRVFSKR